MMLTNLIAAAALILTYATADADPIPEPVDQCSTFGQLAQNVMEGRQGGIPLSRMMEIANGVPLIEAIILQAYSQPMYRTPEHQLRVVQDFRNVVEVACYNATR